MSARPSEPSELIEGVRTHSLEVDTPRPEVREERPTTPEFELAVESLQRSGRLRLPVSGASMAPVLVPGDEIEIVSCRARDLNLGDIVLFAARDSRGALAGLVVHRLLLDREEGLIARGDGAASVDPVWSRDSVLGLVSTRLRNGVEFKLSPRRRSLRRRVRSFGLGLRVGLLGSMKRRILPAPKKVRRRAPVRSAAGGAAAGAPLNLRFPAEGNSSSVPFEAGDALATKGVTSMRSGEAARETDLPPEPTGSSSPFFSPPAARSPREPAQTREAPPTREAAPPSVAATATPPERPTRPARERRRRRRGGHALNPLRFARRLLRR